MKATDPTPGGLIVKEYVRMYKSKPSREIARIVYAENPGFFKSERREDRKTDAV